MALEYVDSGVWFFGILSLIGLFIVTIGVLAKAKRDDKEIKIHYLLIALMAYTVWEILSSGVKTKNLIERNLALFQKNIELECHIGEKRYLVSKQRGWSVRGEDFIKESEGVLVGVRLCKERIE